MLLKNTFGAMDLPFALVGSFGTVRDNFSDVPSYIQIYNIYTNLFYKYVNIEKLFE